MSAPDIINPGAASGGIPIGGSGAAGYLAKWTATTTLGGSTTTGATASLYVDATGNVGIGTASPLALLHTDANSGQSVLEGLFVRNTNTSRKGGVRIYACADAAGGNIVFGGSVNTTTGNTEPATMTSDGPGIRAVGAFCWAAGTLAASRFYFSGSERTPGAQPTTELFSIYGSGNVSLGATAGVSIQAAGTNQGLKLPATPGNTDPNTLDSYREGTRVLAAGDLTGWTFVTATQFWTLVGRTVTLHTVFTGGTSSASGGATIATPPLLTPLRIAAGAAVNSSGTALGNGVCVVASTSSTTGTVITSSAISSSAVDKVLTVTYETAGL